MWRPDDAQALRATIPELGLAEASQVLADLSRAINTGQPQVALYHRPDPLTDLRIAPGSIQDHAVLAAMLDACVAHGFL